MDEKDFQAAFEKLQAEIRDSSRTIKNDVTTMRTVGLWGWFRLQSVLFQVVAPLIAIGVIVLCVAVAGDYLSDWKDNRQIKKLEEEKATALAEKEKFRIDAESKNAVIGELKTADTAKQQEIDELKAALLIQSKRTERAKTIYVESKNTPSGYIPLTGNTDTDTRDLCAELAKRGFRCQ